ncbi:PLP-dependent transferase [Decorospora gaudefroyi]|uniref:PLP-dependent transferase n=1 Tax=Decorospora gaudefroyi TaxID=184978 RepID=A0A6A5KGN9_9PLEO|nr:PLP-dependent transferase [Decorospora gaudefroyi]
MDLETKLTHLLTQRQKNSTLRTLTLSSAPTPTTDFSSNDFLTLSTSPLLKSTYLSELPGLPLGSGGSRLLDGNSAYAEALEQEIAGFHGAQAGLLFNSGFDANVGFFACVPQRGDVLVFDELVHASVHDGMRLARAGGRVSFGHNSVEGLRDVLGRVLSEYEGVASGRCHVFVAVESVYSMDGDVAPLGEIVDVVEEVLGKGRGYVVVDEAHSTGVLGHQGRGLVCELGLEDRIFARLHTFGKAIAANGAILLGSATLRHYLINYARPLIYTTFLSYPALALIRSSYMLLRSGKTVHLQAHLHSLTQTLFTRLNELQTVSGAARMTLRIPNACPQSPIFAVQLVRPRALASFLQSRGMMVRAVVPPTVPMGTDRVRICLHAGNTVTEVEQLVQALQIWCEDEVKTSQEGDVQVAATRARL